MAQTVEQIMKTIHELKVEFNKEIQLLKKTQTEKKMEITNWGCWTNISYIEGIIEEMDTSEKKF